MNEIPRAQREHYQKGLAALERNNLDYAIAIFTQVLQQEPAFYDCREALRATQYKKAGGGAGFFKKIFGAASKSPQLAKGQFALKTSKPLEALDIAEQILNFNPHHSAAHKLLADAAMEAGLPRTAVLSLEILNRNNPKDKGVGLELADALAQIGNVEKGERVLSELARAHPNDQTITQAVKDYAAKKTMSEAGYSKVASGEGSYRDILRNEEEARSLEQQARQVKDEDVAAQLIREFEQKLEQQPDSRPILQKLAELHATRKEFDQAVHYYRRIQEVEGGDPNLDKLLAETHLKKFDQALADLNPQDPEYESKAGQIRKEKEDYKIQECRDRAERYPSDLHIRFELGKLLFEAGDSNEAIAEFQKAQHNPHRKISSLHYLGQCFAQRNMHDMAARTFENALAEKQAVDEEKKALQYALGLSYEKMDQPDKAIEQFKRIYEVDMSYKDVSQKVDAYYSSGSGD